MNRSNLQYGIEFAFVFMALLLAVYCFYVYSSKIKENELLYFGIQAICLMIIFMGNGQLLNRLISTELAFIVLTKLVYLAILGLAAFMLIFFYSKETALLGKRWLIPILLLYASLAIFNVVANLSVSWISNRLILVSCIATSLILSIRLAYLLLRSRRLGSRIRLNYYHLFILGAHLLVNLSYFFYIDHLIVSMSYTWISLLLFMILSYIVVAKRFIYHFRHSMDLNEKRDEFLLSSSYELRSPLQAIAHLSQVHLENELEGKALENPSTFRQTSQQINLIADRLLSLIESQADLSLLRSRQRNLPKQPVPVSLIVDIVISSASSYFPDKDIRWRNKIAITSFA